MEDYRGLVGGVAFALRRSESWLLRSYAVASALVGGFVGLLLVLGVVSWLAEPAPLGQRALLGVVGLLVLVPLFAPVLVVARRHRRGHGDRRADALLAIAGYGFVLSVYLALLVSAPGSRAVSGPLGPVVAAVDALPRSAWPVPPLLAAAAIVLAFRRTRPRGDGTDD